MLTLFLSYAPGEKKTDSVYMEKKAALHYVTTLIGSSLQKMEPSGSVTGENY